MGLPSIRVKLAREDAPESPQSEAAPAPDMASTESTSESTTEPAPWEIAPSPAEFAATRSSAPRQSHDDLEIAAAKAAPPAVEPPSLDAAAQYSPWKPAAPKSESLPSRSRSPAAPEGLDLLSTPQAEKATPLVASPAPPSRLDLDEHREIVDASSSRPAPVENESDRDPDLLPPPISAPDSILDRQLAADLSASPRAIAPDQKVLLDENGQPTSVMNLVKQPAAPLRRDGEAVPELLSLRVATNRSELARQFGATEESERAIELALRWLARNQSADGRWDADRYGAGREMKIQDHDRQGAGAKADAAMTGLALLAFLGNGQTHLDGQYRDNVRRGLDYLKRIQRPDGSLYGEAEYFAQMYSHGMATIALGEALALTGDESLRPPLDRAIRYTIAMQHPRYGGWRYTAPQQRPDDLGDMSQFGWQVMALKSASLSGITPPARSRQGMERFMAAVSTGQHGGLAKYYPLPGERPTRTMSAEAACCRFFLGLPESEAQRKECTDYLLAQVPGEGNVDFYYWYYGTLALFQRQGEPWRIWNAALQEQLLDRQSATGEFAGSWDPDRVWGYYGGRVYSTALGALCLEVYYRYLPVYQVIPEAAARDSAPARSGAR